MTLAITNQITQTKTAAGLLAAVAIELPEAIAQQLTAFRTIYDPGYLPALPNGGAHLTLKRPDKTLCPIDSVLQHLRQILSKLSAPQITLNGISIYHSSNESAIFLRVQPDPALLELHRQLHEGLRGWFALEAPFENDYFIPHITLANWLTDQQLAAATADLRKNNLLDFQQTFYGTEISIATSPLAAGANAQRWQRLATFSLALSTQAI